MTLRWRRFPVCWGHYDRALEPRRWWRRAAWQRLLGVPPLDTEEETPW